MTSKERILAALEFRQPDKIPWGDHHFDHNIFEMFLGRETYVNSKFRETQAYWDGKRDEVVEHYKRDFPELIRKLGMDIVPGRVMPPKDYHPKPMERVNDKTYRDEKGVLYKISSITNDLMEEHVNTAYRREATLDSIQKEIEELEVNYPLEFDDPQYELIKHLLKEMGDTHFIMVIINGMEWPRFGRTEEESWMNLVLEPEISKKIAELQGIQMKREAKFFAEMGVDGIMAGGDHGSSTSLLASPKIYKEFCYPWQKAQADVAHSKGIKVLRHCCGHIWPIIEEIAEINDAYQSIQASAGMDIKKLRERLGNKLCLWGGIWHEHIVDGTPDDIRRDFIYAAKYAGQNGGYIMGSSHSLSVGAKKENIETMIRCREEWGHYPLDMELLDKLETEYQPKTLAV